MSLTRLFCSLNFSLTWLGNMISSCTAHDNLRIARNKSCENRLHASSTDGQSSILRLQSGTENESKIELKGGISLVYGHSQVINSPSAKSQKWQTMAKLFRMMRANLRYLPWCIIFRSFDLEINGVSWRSGDTRIIPHFSFAHPWKWGEKNSFLVLCYFTLQFIHHDASASWFLWQNEIALKNEAYNLGNS